MTNLPMTTFGGDGKAPKRRHDPTMSDHNDIEDVEQLKTEIATKKNKQKTLRGFGEAFLKSQIEDLKLEVEEMEDLPTPEEAEMGELARTPRSQFEDCELIDENTKGLIEVHCQEIPKEASDEEVRNSIEEEGI